MKKLFPVFLLVFLFSIDTFAQISSGNETWLAPATKPKLFGLQNNKGEIAVKAQYDFLIEADGTGWIAYHNGKYGVINSSGSWIIKPNFETIVQFVNGKAVVGKKLPAKISQDYSDNLYRDVRTGDQSYAETDSTVYYGVVDASGTWVIDAKYDFLRLCDDGSAQYADGIGNFGFLNPDGTVLIRAQYQYASRMTDGVAVIGQGVPENTMNRYNRNNRYQISQGKYSVIDRTGKEVTVQTYPLIREFSEGRAAFNKDGMWKVQRYSDESSKLIGGKWGYLDENGKEIIEAKYDYVYDFKNGKAKVRSGVRIFWIDKDGKESAAPQQETKAFTIYCEPGFYGYLDLKGNWAIAPQYFSANEFSEGMAAVVTLHPSDMNCNNGVNDVSDEVENSRSTYSKPLSYLLSFGSDYNDDYNDVSRLQMDSARMADSISTLYARRLYGYIDATGNMVLPAKYEVALPFHDGRAYVSYRGKWGVIDKKGNWIFAPVLEWPEELNGLNPDYYGYGGRFNFVTPEIREAGDNSEDSEEVESASLPANRFYKDPVYSFHEGIGVILKYNKYGFIDTSGKIIASPVYDEVLPFANGFAAVRHGNFWGFIDRTGKEIIPMQFKSATSFSKEGLACVGTTADKSGSLEESSTMRYESDYNVYYGYIDKKGNWVIKPQFTTAAPFSEGLAAVSSNFGKTGYIDRTGKFIIAPKYDVAFNFQNGFALVKINLFKAVYIDKTGKVSKTVTPEKPPFDKSVPLAMKQGPNFHYGFVNEKGEAVIDYQFSRAGNFSRVK